MKITTLIMFEHRALSRILKKYEYGYIHFNSGKPFSIQERFEHKKTKQHTQCKDKAYAVRLMIIG